MSPEYAIFGSVVDCIFGLDMCITARTSIYNESTDYIETIPINILKQYFSSGWLFLDLVSTVPIDSLVALFMTNMSSAYQSIRILKFIRLMRILKILRMSKLLKVLVRIENLLGISPAVFELSKYLLVVLLIVHCITCLWFFATSVMTENPWFLGFDGLDSCKLSFTFNTISHIYTNKHTYIYFLLI